VPSSVVAPTTSSSVGPSSSASTVEPDSAPVSASPSGDVLQDPLEDPLVDHGLIADDAITYDDNVTKLLAAPTKLDKPKILYREKDKSAKKALGTIPAGSAITILEVPAKATARMWARVSGPVKGGGTLTGYINTHFAINGGKIAHQAVQEAVMGQNGPKPEHVAQGMHGDCFLLAALMGLARRSPDKIKAGVFQSDPQTPQATHKLRFFNVPKATEADQTLRPETVSVSSTVLGATRDVKKKDNSVMTKGSQYGAQGSEVWPAIIEKAFAAWPGRPNTETLAGGHGDMALSMLTGERHKDETLYADAAMERQAHTKGRAKVPSGLGKYEAEDAQKKAVGEERDKLIKAKRPLHQQALIDITARGEAATIGTNQSPSTEWLTRCGGNKGGVGSSGEMKVGGIAHKHVYELVEASTAGVKMRNPWGKYARIGGKVKEDKAVSELTWDEFFEVASSYSVKV
jgi:hypothetical protein